MIPRFITGILVLLVIRCEAQESIEAQFQKIAKLVAAQYNVSVSLAAKLDSGEEFKAASGSAGHNVSTASLIPAGSAAKPFTALGLLRLADAGVLDLDAPIAELIDPWHAHQSPPIPPLKEIFRDAANISKVTTKHLIGMKSGIEDYNSSGMFEWTIHHPDSDYLPMDYISDVGKKPFLFDPGAYTAYSSNGYVLAGMVLAAHQGVKWEDLDQLAAVGPVDGKPLENTIFMKKGKCSKYPGVTHQYALGAGQPFTMWELEPVMEKNSEPGTCAAESDQLRHVRLDGWKLGSFKANSYEACCEGASKSSGQAFTYEQGNCTVFRYPQKGYPALNANSGFTVHHFKESDLIDLYDYSCLNGWTMGNIAWAPIDAVKLWHALFIKKSLVSAKSLELMTTFNGMSHGWGEGMSYGYGLMKTNPGNGLRLRGQCAPPLCVCHYGQCQLNATLIGHLGADWGSSMPLNGHIPELRASVAASMSSAFHGLNTTLTTHQNSAVMQVLECYMLQVLFQRQVPGFPDFMCPPLQGWSSGNHEILV